MPKTCADCGEEAEKTCNTCGEYLCDYHLSSHTYFSDDEEAQEPEAERETLQCK